MILLPNEFFFVTEITYWGPQNIQITFKSDHKNIGPSKYLNNYVT